MGRIISIKNEDSNGIHYDFYDEDNKKGTVNIPNDIPFVDFNNNNNNNNKHLKRLLFDDLVYRYKNAVEQLAMYEFMMDKEHIKPLSFYQSIARNNLMQYINLLNEAIGDHD